MEMSRREEYAPSIMQNDCRCFLCGNENPEMLDRHEPFGGGLRQKSKKYGMWMYLCHDTCHLNGAHHDPLIKKYLMEVTQKMAMSHYGWSVDEFIALFGKNHL